MKVLIVSENWTDAAAVAETLQRQGHEVLRETTAAEGLRTAVKQRPGVLIVEQDLPDYPGAEILVRVRKIAPAMRVVMLVPFRFASLCRRLEEAGAETILAKSRPVTETFEALKEILEAPVRRTNRAV